jgi:hypothetical protein
LLTSDVTQITDALATDQKLLDKIMLFVDTDGLLNPLQTSFFSKVVGLLITRKSEVVGSFSMLVCALLFLVCILINVNQTWAIHTALLSKGEGTAQ